MKLVAPDDEYVLYFNYFRTSKKLPEELLDCAEKYVNRIPAKIQRAFHNHLRLPIEMFAGKADVFHSPNYFLPPSISMKQLVTVHDLTFVRFPETMSPGDDKYFAKYVPQAIKRANMVLTISENSKKELISDLGVSEDKIRVTYMAADKMFKPIKDQDKLQTVREKYNLPEKYILYVGTLEPRKNITVIIEAIHALKRNHGIEHKLVIAGKKGWLYDKIFQRVVELGLENDVVFTGFVADEDLPALFNMASLFVFPSLYEGFGIPPLEAMACGVPVITSDSSSLPEVVKGVGIMLAPTDIKAWIEAMHSVLTKPELANDMSTKGLERAKLFSWEKTALQTHEAYKEVLSSS
jgi:glycosyltransferase involved in cell wall biosynthesis